MQTPKHSKKVRTSHTSILRFVIIGCGGREHAIAKALTRRTRRTRRDSNKLKLYCIGTWRNRGIEELVDSYHVVDTITNYDDVKGFLPRNTFVQAIVVIGPEAPLAAGLVDRLLEEGYACIGPTKTLAQIETSKTFARSLLEGDPALRKYCPRWTSIRATAVDKDQQILEILRGAMEQSGGYVVKADGLRGGKGVRISGLGEGGLRTLEEGVQYCDELIDQDGIVLIEERLRGREFSLMGLCDGKGICHLPVVQDYKRSLPGDEGPNTGGMGAISYPSHSLPWLPAEKLQEAQEVNGKVLQRLQAYYPETPYIGVLYGSFMLTEEGELKVIEYNARFGDPEVLNLMHLLETDLADIFLDMVRGTLYERDSPVIFRPEYCVTRYAVPLGYPTRPQKGDLITFTPNPNPIPDIIHASIESCQDCNEFRMLGSRAFALTHSTPQATPGELRAFLQEMTRAFDAVTGSFRTRNDIGEVFLEDSSDTPLTYRQAGVDIDEGNRAVDRIASLVEGIGGFGGAFPLRRILTSKDSSQLSLIASMDGVGTKVQTLLNLLPRDQAFHTLGRDLFANNLNDILCLGMEVRPLFFLDYFGCRKLATEDLYNFVEGLSQECRVSDCVLLGGETAELPDFSKAWEHYHHNHPTEAASKASVSSPHFEMVGTVVGLLDEKMRFHSEGIEPGNIVLALPSSGPHTNGYSLINQLITSGRLDPTPYLKELCAPHRNYYEPLRALSKRGLSDRIKGLAHITGGGLIDNPPRMLPSGLTIQWTQEIDRSLPPMFRAIQKAGNLSKQEMWRTFNCGIGLILVTDVETATVLLGLGGDDFRKVGQIIDKNDQDYP